MAHAHLHAHGADEPDPPISPVATRALLAVVVPLVLATVVGLVVLWPRGDMPDLAEGLDFPTELVDGTVVDEASSVCTGAQIEDGPRCASIDIELTSGPEKGETVSLETTRGPSAPELHIGDRIVLGHVEDLPEGAPAGSEYYFADYQRKVPMLWLALLFAGAVVLLGRWRGLRALVGLGLSLFVLTGFVLPSILEGNNPVAVAIVGSAAILVLALYLAHGFNVRTTTAVLGTLASLAVTGVLAVVFVQGSRLTGLASEEAVYLRISAEAVNLQGLLLGGIIIGSLGVLDDVTVTQASAVWELRKANRTLGARELYTAALRIGRDHIASTVNTLVLAYAGASLPLMILFTQANRPLAEVVSGEVVAVEVIRTLVGSVGLVASVPVTTALTAVVVAGWRPRQTHEELPA